jgi:predicted DNA-binding transcriptional regulator YafY
MARAPYRQAVTLRMQGTIEQIRQRLPASVAEVQEYEDEGWQRVEVRAESLDWLPGVLAALDLPFVIERPDELRDRVVALADKLAASARKLP